MPHAVRMPRPGQMTEECVLSMWRKAEGEHVAEGDVIFEIETDKSTMEVESFHDGVLLKQLASAGDTVPVNEICAWIGEPGEAIPEADEVDAGPVASHAAAPPPVPDRAGETGGATAGEAAGPPPDLNLLGAAASEPPSSRNGGRLAISPRARSRAVAAGLDPRSIAGSGPDHRIVERDVVAAIAARDAQPRPAAVAAPLMQPADGEDEPRPLSRIRRVIAERLTLSATSIPTFSATVAADLTRILAVREELRAAGSPVTITDVVLAATAQTLAEFPDVNSRTDGLVVWPRRRVHLGIAVALPAGLIVAVIRDADRLRLLEIHAEAARLVADARAGRLPPESMTGSTFTVSNLGMHGIDAFTAIINPGESGILAVGSAIPTPTALNGGIAIRTLMRLTLSADHRLIDGELAARFLGALRRRLEDPTALRRELESS